MTDKTPLLNLPYLLASQADKHVTVNEAFQRLDVLTQCVVESRKHGAQPTAPIEGQTWILPANCSGVRWSGMIAGSLVRFVDDDWHVIEPRAGFAAFVIDEARICLFDGATWAVQSNANDPENRLLNGNFQIWQRGGIFSPIGMNEFGPDRWRAIHTNAGAPIINWTRVSPAPSSLLPASCTFALRAETVAAGTSPVGLEQAIEDVRTLGGRQVCLSYYVRASAPIVVTPTLEQRFGVGGSGSVMTGFWTTAIDTNWTRYDVAIQLPTMIGKTIGPASSLALRLVWPAVTGGWVEITGIKLEVGRAPSQFDARLEGPELALCQRYFFSTLSGRRPIGGAGLEGALMQSRLAAGVYFHRMLVRFPVSMRTIPTLTLLNPLATGSQAVDIDAGTTCSSTVPLSLGQSADQAVIFTQTPAGGVPGNTLTLHVVASAEL